MTRNSGDRVDQKLDVPLTVPAETAEAILADLRDGERVNLWIDADDAPDLIDQLQWQLENGQQVTELVDEYTEDTEATA